jgi:methionyl-tRNA formyltransferase
MRIILIGQAAFAEKVLEGMHAAGHEVAAVYCPPERAGGKPDPLKVRAEQLGIACRQHRSLRGPEVEREFTELSADLAVLAYVTQIVPQAIIDRPRLGSICFHPSLLPKYRGGSAIPWQIIKGETKTGVTVFWTDPGIDTGPILIQKAATVGADDTAATLYYQTLFPLGVEAVLEAVDLIARGTAPRVMQNDAEATYDPLLSDEHARVEWNRPIGEVYNLIRGCDPQPGAYVDRNGVRVRFFDARQSNRRDIPPGVIAELSEHGVTVGARGGAVRIGRMRIGDRKIPAAEAIAELGLDNGLTL